MFAYLSGSPFVFIERYGVSPQQYGWICGTNALGLVVAAQVNRWLLDRFSGGAILAAGLRASAAAGLGLALLAATGAGGLAGLLPPLFVCGAGYGIIAPYASAAARAPYANAAGSAAALRGVVQFVVSGVAGALVGRLGDSTALPMAGVIAGCGLAALVVFGTLARSPGSMPASGERCGPAAAPPGRSPLAGREGEQRGAGGGSVESSLAALPRGCANRPRGSRSAPRADNQRQGAPLEAEVIRPHIHASAVYARLAVQVGGEIGGQEGGGARVDGRRAGLQAQVVVERAGDGVRPVGVHEARVGLDVTAVVGAAALAPGGAARAAAALDVAGGDGRRAVDVVDAVAVAGHVAPDDHVAQHLKTTLMSLGLAS